MPRPTYQAPGTLTAVVCSPGAPIGFHSDRSTTPLQTAVVWIEPNVEGLDAYLSEQIVRGVLLVNVPSRIEVARGVIRDGKPIPAAERAAMLMAGA